jgi:hypothetical protein
MLKLADILYQIIDCSDIKVNWKFKHVFNTPLQMINHPIKITSPEVNILNKFCRILDYEHSQLLLIQSMRNIDYLSLIAREISK